MTHREQAKEKGFCLISGITVLLHEENPFWFRLNRERASRIDRKLISNVPFAED